MAKVEFIRPEDRTFRPAGAYVSEEERAAADPGELEGHVAIRYPGGPDSLQMLDVRYPPGVGVAPHAHAVDEVFLVLEGHVRFGRQEFGAGTSIHVPANTLYSFTAGDDGVTLLNFRPRQDKTLIRPAELRAMQLAAKHDADDS